VGYRGPRASTTRITAPPADGPSDRPPADDIRILPTTSPRTRRVLRRLTAASAVACLLALGAWAVLTLDVAAVANALTGADQQMLLLAVLLYVAGQTASGAMWARCQRAGGVEGIPLRHALGMHWIARGACEALPASLGEGVRIALVRRHPAGARAGAWRITGGIAGSKIVEGAVTALVVVAIAAAAPPPGPAGDVRWAALGSVAAALGVVVLARMGVLGRLAGLLPARPRTAVRRVGEGARAAVDPRAVRIPSLLALAAVALRILSLAALLAALGIPAGAALMVFALVVVSGLLPIAPGGAGTREAVLVPALALAHGVPGSTALAASLAIQVVALLPSLLLAGLALAWLGPGLLRGELSDAPLVELPAEPATAADPA
jgi:uncharacterized membrane protein YbhN (UPF0104 family)